MIRVLQIVPNDRPDGRADANQLGEWRPFSPHLSRRLRREAPIEVGDDDSSFGGDAGGIVET